MIHYKDEALFNELVQKGKAYADGKYDFTFDNRYLIYHVTDVKLRYIVIDAKTGLASEVKRMSKGSHPYTETTYPKLISNILNSIKYNGDAEACKR